MTGRIATERIPSARNMKHPFSLLVVREKVVVADRPSAYRMWRFRPRVDIEHIETFKRCGIPVGAAANSCAKGGVATFSNSVDLKGAQGRPPASGQSGLGIV